MTDNPVAVAAPNLLKIQATHTSRSKLSRAKRNSLAMRKLTLLPGKCNFVTSIDDVHQFNHRSQRRQKRGFDHLAGVYGLHGALVLTQLGHQFGLLLRGVG